MWHWWRIRLAPGLQARAGRGRRRGCRLSCEAIETRVVPSALAPGGGMAAHRHHAAVVAAMHRPHGSTLAGTPGHPTVGKQVEFAVTTVQKGREMAYSPAVRKVGVSYAKLGLAHDTRKVGAAYFDAAINGDGKKLDQLGHTHLVKKVGQDFASLSKTRLVRNVGDAFTRFGQSVADQFNKLF